MNNQNKVNVNGYRKTMAFLCIIKKKFFMKNKGCNKKVYLVYK